MAIQSPASPSLMATSPTQPGMIKTINSPAPVEIIPVKTYSPHRLSTESAIKGSLAGVKKTGLRGLWNWYWHRTTYINLGDDGQGLIGFVRHGLRASASRCVTQLSFWFNPQQKEQVRAALEQGKFVPDPTGTKFYATA